MTGPEHYHKAEILLALDAHDASDAALILGQAQVHATLALAAATAVATRDIAWLEAASERKNR